MNSSRGIGQGWTYYEHLGVGQDATSEQIRQAHKTRIKRLHPDLHPGPYQQHLQEIVKRLNEGRDVLLDPDRRAAYDKKLNFQKGQHFGDRTNQGTRRDKQYGERSQGKSRHREHAHTDRDQEEETRRKRAEKERGERDRAARKREAREREAREHAAREREAREREARERAAIKKIGLFIVLPFIAVSSMLGIGMAIINGLSTKMEEWRHPPIETGTYSTGWFGLGVDYQITDSLEAETDEGAHIAKIFVKTEATSEEQGETIAADIDNEYPNYDFIWLEAYKQSIYATTGVVFRINTEKGAEVVGNGMRSGQMYTLSENDLNQLGNYPSGRKNFRLEL